MGTREILSLQFGHYSNFIGTHWWNTQETSFEYNATSPAEINHDILFREGSTRSGQVTFTPRLLLVDLKGSLRTLPERGTLYESPPKSSEIDTNWKPSATETKINEPEQKNVFQEDLENSQITDFSKRCYNLESDVEVWSDFLYTRFHPRTVNIIKEYEHENKDSQFDVFPLGTAMWRSEQFEEDFSDKIRNYIEECDNFQGFHITLDASNAFAGLASSCIEYVRDEYERKSVLAFPVIPSSYSDYAYVTDEEKHQSLIKDSIRVLNLALCFNSLNEHSSLFLPLCTSYNGWRQPGPMRNFYHLVYNYQLPYHTSAILASALDTITLKYRLRSTDFHLSDLCADLNIFGRKAAATSLCLPFSFNKGSDFIDCLDNWDGPLSQSISPNCIIGTDKLMQTFTLRGIPEDRLKRPLQNAGKQKDMPAYRCNSVNEMLSLYLSCNYFISATNVTTVTKGLSVKTPYPSIFDPFVGTDGNINNTPRPEHLKVESVPTLAGIHSGACVGDMIESLHTEANKIKVPRFHQFVNAGLESDEFSECLHKLFDLRECYVESDYI
ncbi:hypothetical protein ILUMI_06229 [Ignelater luminosus]|uniref:Protein misato n=1 Tax=Ignelater luminosus TaxID=2038154 RepID=A0A8K0DBI0_IGNLU|nr:hypothetical protein ILUMI_06229 [Ignelater luminosus]